MKILTDQAIENKFRALLDEGHQILKHCGWDGGKYTQKFPNDVDYQRWSIQAANLIDRVCGRNSVHYQSINSILARPDRLNSFHLKDCVGILEGAHNDYADGFLAEIRYLVRADLIEDFLTQAEALLDNGYHAAAASLAGAVLEDTLRKLCDKHAIGYNPAKTNIEALNTDLARVAIYDKLAQKEITAKAHLRNEADHGHFGNVKEQDVKDMLRWVQRFAAEHLK